MNFLFVTTISGFLTQFEYNDARLAKEMGCDLYYASNFNRPVYKYDRSLIKELGIKECPIDIEKSPLKIRSNIRAVRQLKRIIDEENIDVIHCHNPMGGVCARVAGRLSRKRPYVIYTAHGFHFYKGAPLKNRLLFYPAEYMLARWTDCIITINREDYESAGRLPVRRKRNVYQIHSVGVDRERFRPKRELREKKRAELGIPESAFHIVTAAELNDNKNMSAIIKALAVLNKKDIYYSICGEGPKREELSKLIMETGLTGRVRLLGYRTDMDEVLSAADVFAFPSKREGLGVAAVEALLSGVPLIASDNRGTREYAVDGVNSIVCKTGTTGEYAEAIRKLYTDTDLRENMAPRCVASAEKFGQVQVGKKMKIIYEKAFNETKIDVKR